MSTTTDQDFLDTLTHLPTDLLSLSLSAIEAFERSCDSLAISLRNAVGRAPPPPPPTPAPRLILSRTLGRRTADWLWENRAVVMGMVAFVGTGSALYWRQRRAFMARRRARRGKDGGRKEIVVIAGNPANPLTRALVLDLERRLFIPHVIARTSQEEELVKREGKRDIVPLHLDVTDPFDVEQTISNFAGTLSGSAQELNLAGLVVIPDSHYRSGPIEQLSPELWSDAFDTHLIHTIATIQAFIPLLIQYKSRALVLTPTITSSLQLPFHAIETATTTALESLLGTLAAELSQHHVGVSNVRLGNFQVDDRDSKTALVRNASSEILSWPQAIKERYGKAFMSITDNAGSSRGSPLRELHNTIFDALTQESMPSSTICVGRGSRLYPFVGRWAPRTLVAWMMGSRVS